jgi:hypothetical protein
VTGQKAMMYGQHVPLILLHATFWDNWKDEVYRMNPHSEEELKENTQREILGFS